MRKTSIICVCLLSLILLIASCSKSNLDQPGFPGFRCSYGNAEYVADTAFYTRSLGTTIYAQTAGNSRFIFYLPHTDTIGTISLDGNLNTAYCLADKSYRSTSGSITITQYYNDSLAMISGTFSFWGKANDSSTLNVTYGYFNNIPRH